MKLTLRRHWLLGLFLLGWVPLLIAQVNQQGPKVQEIKIQHVGPPAVSDDLIRANLRIKVGDTYNESATNDDIRTLLRTGYFANVQVVREIANGGIKLIYVVQGKLVLTDIRFEGNKKYSISKLSKKVSSKIGEPVDEYKLFRDAQEIKKLYEKAGYLQVKVDPAVTPNETAGRATATFRITETPKVRVVDVQFDGAKAFSQRKLRRTIKTRRFWMFSWLTSSGKLKEVQFQEDKERLKEFYWNEGYIDFEIKDVKFDYLNPERMIIRFIVFEGKQYKVGSVEFKGTNKFTADQIRRGTVDLGKVIKVRMLEGETFTPKGLQRDIEAIQDYYGAHGYIGRGRDDVDHIRVVAVKNPNVERGTMDLVYRIEEGESSRIERIEIKGNTKTKDKVIRRELAVAPGELFDMVRVKLSKQRLEGLQYFTKVDTEVEPTEVPYRKNLIVAVEEGQSGNFYVGAGFSSIDQLFGYIGMTQGNFDLFNPPFFTGGGQKLRLQATVGTEQENYEITFVEPWLFDRKLALEVSLFHRDIQYYSDLYDQRETGATFELTRAVFVDAFRVGLNYTIENIGLDFDDGASTTNIVVSDDGRFRERTIIPPQISPTLLAEEGDRLVSKVGVSLTLDTRGGGLLPSRGQRTRFTAYVAGGPLGGDTDFYKLDLESSWYFRGFLPGHILEVIGKVGVVEPFGDSTTVPLFDRFFLGGAYTLRGYKYREVGPKDEFGEPIGGNTYWFGSVEYSIPIIERLRFAMFYDIGMVYPESYDFDFSHYNDNWGVGIRINIPQMGPLRLDYGIPITHDPGTSGSGRFQFSVGYFRPF